MKWGTGKKYDTGEVFGEPTSVYTKESVASCTYTSDTAFGSGYFGLGSFGPITVTYTTDSIPATVYTLE